MKLFHELADVIEHRWRMLGYDDEVFPRLAAEALTDARLPERITPWAILRDIGQAGALTEQRDLPSGFSNLPLTLANRSRFYVDLYLWLDGTTTIHQHSFSGAFQVLEGSSLHSRYRFDERRRINEHFRIGDIRLESTELLNQGAIREIIPGTRFAHSLFHLARPSATITVRTFQDVTQLPQLDYLRPAVAINPFFSDQLMTRRVQTAAFLMASAHPETDRIINESLANSDPHTAFLILAEINQRIRRTSLEQLFAPGESDRRFAEFTAVARSRHGELIDEFLPVFDSQNRTAEIVQRRAQVTSDDHRYFLALLLNLPDRAHIVELIGDRYPDADPLELMLEWVGELGRTRVWNSPQPNVLGLPEFDEDYLFVLELMLSGKTESEIATAVDAEYSSDQAAVLQPKIGPRCDELRRSPLFYRLLR